MQRIRQLGGGIAACPRIRHGQRGRNTLGREEEIAASLPQLAIQVNGEGIVAFDYGGLVRRGQWWSLRRPCGYRQENAGDEQRL
ncbi:MAG: hypothetical protein WBW03_13775 [Silvibacterium sp.]